MTTWRARLVGVAVLASLLVAVPSTVATATQGATVTGIAFPDLVDREPAVLPSGAAAGQVVLMFVVTPTGGVSFVKTLAGDDRLRPAAEAALARWRFASGRRAVTGLVSLGVGRADAFSPRALAPVHDPRPTVARGDSGVVVVEVGVAPDGHIETARAVSGPPALRGAAETALKAWRYPPAALPFMLTVSVRVDAQGRAD